MLIRSDLLKLLKSNRGVSIVMVVVALAMVSAGTLYVMDLNKNAKVQFAQSRSTSYAEMERRRIGTILGERSTCILANNFLNKPVIQTDIASLRTSDNTTVFLAKNGTYYQGALTVSNIQTRVNTNAAAQGLTGSKAYELVVTYSAAKSKAFSTGRSNVVIRIPMYMKLDASSNILDCYAMVGNTNVDAVIAAACSPAVASNLRNAYTTSTTAATVSDCNHNITFQTTSTATECPTVGTNATQQGFNSFTLNSNTLSFQTTNCTTGMTGAGSCTADMKAYTLAGSAPTCAYPGGSRDGACGAGQILWHTSGTTTACVTVSCTGTNFVQTVTGAGTTCFTAPNTTCPAGQYVYRFNQSGSDDCQILPVFSGTCAASAFGTSITRATASAGGTLNCTAYNMAKSCGAPTNTTFITSTSNTTNGPAVCTQF